MAVSRRRFLQDGVFAATACLAVPLAGWAAGPAMRGATVVKKGPPSSSNPSTTPFGGLENISRQDFADAVGSSFQVNFGGAAPVWMSLLAVNDFAAPPPLNPASMAVMPPKSSAPAVVTATYSLSFAGTGSEQLPQGTHTFDHPQLGQFALFVVSGTGPQQTSSAVINQLQAAGASGLPVVHIVPSASGGLISPVGGLTSGGFTPAAGAAAQPAGSPATAPATGPIPDVRTSGGFSRGRGLIR